MLRKVTIENFGPINEEITFSMVKGRTEQFPENVIPDTDLLKTILIYGANNSGKSRFISAFKLLNELFIKGKSLYTIGYLPNIWSKNIVSDFKFEFNIENKKIEYSLGISFVERKIYTETLFVDNKLVLFREDDKAIRNLNLTQIKEKNPVQNKFNEYLDKELLENGLEIDKSISYLSYHYNTIGDNEEINSLYRYVENIFYIDQQRRDEVDSFYGQFDDELIEYIEKNTSEVNELLKKFGFDFKVKIKQNEKSIEKEKRIHIKKSELSEAAYIPTLELTESFGTVMFLKLLVSALSQKEKSFLMIIDEIERGIHASLVANFVKYINKELPNVQLILPTHMTDLLNTDLDIRKDQIYITEIKDGKFSIKRNFNKKQIRETMNFQKLLKSNAVGGLPNISINEKEEDQDE